MTQTNTTQNKEELVIEIMQAGFDNAMGGDAFKSEDENILLQQANFDKTVKKYAQLLDKSIQQAHQSGIEEERKRIRNK